MFGCWVPALKQAIVWRAGCGQPSAGIAACDPVGPTLYIVCNGRDGSFRSVIGFFNPGGGFNPGDSTQALRAAAHSLPPEPLNPPSP